MTTPFHCVVLLCRPGFTAKQVLLLNVILKTFYLNPTTRGGRPRPRMWLISGDRASTLRVNLGLTHTLESARCACVLV